MQLISPSFVPARPQPCNFFLFTYFPSSAALWQLGQLPCAVVVERLHLLLHGSLPLSTLSTVFVPPVSSSAHIVPSMQYPAILQIQHQDGLSLATAHCRPRSDRTSLAPLPLQEGPPSSRRAQSACEEAARGCTWALGSYLSLREGCSACVLLSGSKWIQGTIEKLEIARM